MLETLGHWWAVLNNWTAYQVTDGLLIALAIGLGMAMMLMIGIAVGRAMPMR